MDCHITLLFITVSGGYHSETIFNLQKKTVQYITCSYYKTHTDPLFKSLQFLKIGAMYAMKILKFYFYLYHHKLPKIWITISFSSHLVICPMNWDNRSINLQNSDTNIQIVILSTTNYNQLCRENVHTSFSWLFVIYVINYKETCSLISCYVC